MERYLVPPIRARVDQGAMAMKRHSAFPEALALVEPHYHIFNVISWTLIRGVLLLSIDVVGVFYSPSRLSHYKLVYMVLIIPNHNNFHTVDWYRKAVSLTPKFSSLLVLSFNNWLTDWRLLKITKSWVSLVLVLSNHIIHICRNIFNTIRTSEDTSFRKIYLSLYWKGCVWEGVGLQTELQHIDPPLLWP